MRDDTEAKSSLCNKVGLVLLITLMRVAYTQQWPIWPFRLVEKTRGVNETKFNFSDSLFILSLFLPFLSSIH